MHPALVSNVVYSAEHCGNQIALVSSMILGRGDSLQVSCIFSFHSFCQVFFCFSYFCSSPLRFGRLGEGHSLMRLPWSKWSCSRRPISIPVFLPLCLGLGISLKWEWLNVCSKCEIISDLFGDNRSVYFMENWTLKFLASQTTTNFVKSMSSPGPNLCCWCFQRQNNYFLHKLIRRRALEKFRPVRWEWSRHDQE